MIYFKFGKNRKLSHLRTLAYNCHNLLGVKVVRDGGVTWPPARWLAFKSQPSIKELLSLELHADILQNFICLLIRHMYSAIKGHGAFLNGTKSLKTSNRKSIKESMILLEMPTGANETKKGVALANMTMFMEQAHAVRCPGPAATDIG